MLETSCCCTGIVIPAHSRPTSHPTKKRTDRALPWAPVGDSYTFHTSLTLAQPTVAPAAFTSPEPSPLSPLISHHLGQGLIILSPGDQSLPSPLPLVTQSRTEASASIPSSVSACSFLDIGWSVPNWLLGLSPPPPQGFLLPPVPASILGKQSCLDWP